jgi:hypothetical protein
MVSSSNTLATCNKRVNTSVSQGGRDGLINKATDKEGSP